ncbi:MAG TPA: hypothetical protein VF116_12570 [Ktedonobacterales bacterium]
MRWAWAGALVREFRAIHRRSESPVRVACGALVALLALGLVLGCTPAHGTGATGGTTLATTPATTAVPCPTPTGTASAEQQRLAAAVAAAVGRVPCLDTAYSAADHTAMVTVTIAGTVPTTAAAIAAAQERGKVLCFQAQQAVWTSGVALSAATAAVVGPYLDPYDGPTLAPYASAYLTARTAGSLVWATLSPDSAWAKYDSTFLRQGFDPTDGEPTAAPR